MSPSPSPVIRAAHRRKLDTYLYQTADFLAAMIAWGIFFCYRKNLEGQDWRLSFQDENFWYGVIILPAAWLFFYSLFDRYRDIYRLSRLATLGRTFVLSLIGTIGIFFMLLLDDNTASYTSYYKSFFILFSLHFSLTALSRMILLTQASRRLKAGKIAYRTLIIGGDDPALDLYKDISGRKKKLGNYFVGYLSEKKGQELGKYLPYLGGLNQLERVINEQFVEEVIITGEADHPPSLQKFLGVLVQYEEHVLVKIIPDLYDILLGSVRMNHVFGAVLIEVKPRLMPAWQHLIKRFIDVSVSIIALLLLAPIFAYIAYRVSRSSDGPIFFEQERVGRHGKPFTIYKFRSMYTDAEANGPQLSQDHDPRITPWGAIMRKWRLDELPQFWNVLKGDMSLVGPRPERQFYIDQIIEHAPHYKQLLKLRPGITSWGQVKFGYAGNLQEMLQRLRFDILYLENQSLALDLKILFYTLVVLIEGRGK